MIIASFTRILYNIAKHRIPCITKDMEICKPWFNKECKDHTDPKNYRPIALTGCIFKTMERMINS